MPFLNAVGEDGSDRRRMDIGDNDMIRHPSITPSPPTSPPPPPPPPPTSSTTPLEHQALASIATTATKAPTTTNTISIRTRAKTPHRHQLRIVTQDTTEVRPSIHPTRTTPQVANTAKP